MAKRARLLSAAAGPVLPDELVWEILACLPARGLLRCHAVCRDWRRLATSADFLLAHHRHQPPRPLVFGCARWRSGAAADADAAVDSVDLIRHPAERRRVLGFSDYRQHQSFKIHSSCDGLLLFVSGRAFYICNPATRQVTPVPALTGGGSQVTLYPHPSSGDGEYRVLKWKYPDAVCILAVGSSEKPRRIGLPEAFLPPVFWIDEIGFLPPVLLHGCLHWHLRKPEDAILVFDTVAESFRWMVSPNVDGYGAHLVEIDGGMLGIGIVTQGMAKLWVLQDYETEVWSLRYHVKLPVARMRSIAREGFFSWKIVCHRGEILVYIQSSVFLFLCDTKGNLREKIHLDNMLPCAMRHCLKESLVNHAFFGRHGGAHVGQPQFFCGL
uniref:F-box domain-containing protein n=1 Tax=Oryza nivara TaxID=4536 RepID=A0A0E0GXY7_ORYNI